MEPNYCLDYLSPYAESFRGSSAENEKALMSNVSYASAVSILMYVMICTRPDITQAVSVVSRYISNPEQEH